MNNNNNYRIANPKGKRLIIYFLNAKLQSHINVSTVMVAIFIEMVSFDFDINMMIIFSMFHRVYIHFFYQKKKKKFCQMDDAKATCNEFIFNYHEFEYFQNYWRFI